MYSEFSHETCYYYYFFKIAMLVYQRLCLLVSYRSGPENRCTRKFDGLEHHFPYEIVISWVFPFSDTPI
jgi:hypothetical protein